jgi:hypothetical protein
MEWSNISLYNSNALPNLPLQIEQQDKNVNKTMLNIDQTLTLYGVILLTWNCWHIGHDNNTNIFKILLNIVKAIKRKHISHAIQEKCNWMYDQYSQPMPLI